MEQLSEITLPELNLSQIATQIPETSFDAVLLMMPGQYLLRYREQERIITKFIAPEAVSTAFSQIPIDSGFLPSGIVRWGISKGQEWVVQFLPSRTQGITLFLDGQLQALKMSLPSLILLGYGHNYWLWAIKSKQFSGNPALFHAPFPNIYPTGQICFGNNTVISATPQHLAKVWQLFFDAPFNNHLVQGKSKRYPQDIRLLLCQLATKKTYPVRDLQPCYRSLNQVITEILG